MNKRDKKYRKENKKKGSGLKGREDTPAKKGVEEPPRPKKGVEDIPPPPKEKTWKK